MSKMSYNPQFDDMLFAILNHVGGIDKFLDVMFSFLYRRTDFFTVKKGNSEEHGLPPGVGPKMVKMIYQRYVQLERAKNMSTMNLEPSPAKVCKEGAAKSTDEKPSQEQKAKDTVVVEMDSTLQNPDLSKQGSTSKAEESDRVLGAASEVEERPVKADKEAEDPERRYYDSNPECYNGASYDNYSWAQNINELDVQVKVPNGVKSGEQVKVLIKRNHLKVEVLQDENWQVLLDGVLSYEVKMEGSTWTLHPDDHVHVQLEKSYERYWEALLEGEPKINVRTIDCSKPYEDLEPEAQAKLQEMMFDQHQKMLGKPTSQQIQVQEMLKKAWNKKNSPFKGQEFDPSLFNVAP